MASIAILLAFLGVLPLAAAAQSTEEASTLPSAPVEAAVIDAISANGAADFWIMFQAEADLSGGYGISDWAARGQYVYDRLNATAAASQADIAAGLATRNVSHESFFIVNAIRVQGGTQADVDWARTQSGVAEIIAPVTYAIPEPIEEPAGFAPDVVEWGIANINADDVWATFGVRGEGIVVANIDTGVQFDHPALVNQYRGNTGGGTFDHNYNWFDAAGSCATAPCDGNGHGTHTMGTMVGDDGGGNQIGVAPAARWIAANGCCPSDQALIDSGEWMLAPTDLNGDNPRTDLRPNIINNSWGSVVPSNDPFMEDVLEAWATAGIFGMWSNGNSGPSCSTSGSPGSRILNYSAGAYDINNVIAGFSARGPGQDGEIKPNIAAPGVNVRSSLPVNSYGNFSGTSMASPHTAGTVALMWSAAPTLTSDIGGTRALLDDTAVDVDDTSCGGDADDNNVFGEGRLDAFTAVDQSPRGPTGSLTGTVTDAATADPIAGATVSVTIDGRPRSATTGPDGTYEFSALPVGTYDFTASAFGYGSETASATITEGAAATLDFALDAVPSHPVSGTVTDDNGDPVAGATVTITGTPIPPAITDANGAYAFASVPEGTYTMTVNAGGCFATFSTTLVVDGPEVVDVTLGRRSDAYGHTCANEPSAYVEATDATGLVGDDATVEIDLPFEFPFYGSFYDSVHVATNGFMNFSEPNATFTNSAIPSTATPNNAIYPFWDDLFIDGPAQVLTADLGDRFVIEWRDVRPYGAATPNWDFEAVLYEGSGEILFQYRGIEDAQEQGSSATVGIENADGTDALQYSYNQAVLSDASAIRFTPPPSGSLIGTVTDANDGLPISGVTVTATSGATVRTTTTDADGTYGMILPLGTYTVEFTKTNYEPVTDTVVIDEVGEEVTLDVSMNTGIASVEPDSIEAVLLSGWIREYIVTLTNTGSAPLTWEAREIGGGRVNTAAVLAANGAMRNPDADPNARTSRDAFIGRSPQGAAPQAPGDVITSWPATGVSLPWGVGYTGNVWISDPVVAPPTNTEFTTDGTPTGLVHDATWAGIWAADMAYDASRGWMCQADVGGDNGIYCWDPASGAVGDSMTGSPWANTSQRGLAYNPDDDTFYIGGWNEGIVYHVAGFSHPTPGETLGQCNPSEPSFSGLAYNNSAGVLWMTTNSPDDTIYQLNPSDCSTISTVAFPDSAGFSGAGVEMAEDGNLWLANQSNGNVYLIDSGVPAFSDVSWLDVVPDSGRLLPGASEDITITIDTTGLEPGEYTAAVVLVTNAGRVPRVTIPIHLVVTEYLVNVNAGGPAIPTDSAGNPWEADQAFEGSWGYEHDSRTRSTSAPIGGTEDDAVYQDARTGRFFNYRFNNLPDGVYEVVLHFAEIQGKAPGQRRFDVGADGSPLLLAYDIAEDVGWNYAAVHTYLVEVTDGQLRIQFNERFRYGQPIVNGVQLTHRPDLAE